MYLTDPERDLGPREQDKEREDCLHLGDGSKSRMIFKMESVTDIE